VDATVLLTGESGTGKGLLARAIHTASARSRAAFVAVNCASVPESLFESEFFGHMRGAFTGAHQAHRGLLEQADGGTLFLDEIGELAPALQAKLLTAVEDREFRRVGGERPLRVDLRLIAATSVDLEAAVAAGRFRRDLFHRLLVLSFRLPPLRERPGDAERFTHRFLAAFTARYGRPARDFDARALERIRLHPWPGNIRQLANAIEAAVLACEGTRILPRHLPRALLAAEPAAAHGAPGLSATVRLAEGAAGAAPGAGAVRARYTHYGDPLDERRRIEDALRRWRGNKTRAAEDLGMARNTLRAKLQALGLEASGRRDPDATPPASSS
jgi:DNA-binding NtrC family response regulator